MSTVVESITRDVSCVMITLMPPRVAYPGLPVVIGMTRSTRPLSVTVIVCRVTSTVLIIELPML